MQTYLTNKAMSLNNLPDDINIELLLSYFPERTLKVAMRGLHKRNTYNDIIDVEDICIHFDDLDVPENAIIKNINLNYCHIFYFRFNYKTDSNVVKLYPKVLKKKRANELDDDFDYVSQKNNDSINNDDNQLFKNDNNQE